MNSEQNLVRIMPERTILSSESNIVKKLAQNCPRFAAENLGAYKNMVLHQMSMKLKRPLASIGVFVIKVGILLSNVLIRECAGRVQMLIKMKSVSHALQKKKLRVLLLNAKDASMMLHQFALHIFAVVIRRLVNGMKQNSLNKTADALFVELLPKRAKNIFPLIMIMRAARAVNLAGNAFADFFATVVTRLLNVRRLMAGCFVPQLT